MNFLNKKILVLFLSLLTLNNFSFGSIRKKLERRRNENSPLFGFNKQFEKLRNQEEFELSNYNDKKNFMFDNESLDIISLIAGDEITNVSPVFKYFCFCINTYLQNQEPNDLKNVKIENYIDDIIDNIVVTTKLTFDTFGDKRSLYFKELWTKVYNDLKDEAFNVDIVWSETDLMRKIVSRYDIENFEIIKNIANDKDFKDSILFRDLCKEVIEYYSSKELQKEPFENFISEKVAVLVKDPLQESIEFFEEWLDLYTLFVFEANNLGIGEFIFPSNYLNMRLIDLHLKGAELTEAEFKKKFKEKYL